jgi:hypothetical protein
MWALRKSTEYTIRGKVVASPKFELGVLSLVSPSLPVVLPSTKSVPIRH